LVEGNIGERSASPPERRETMMDMTNSQTAPNTHRESPSLSKERAGEKSDKSNITGE